MTQPSRILTLTTAHVAQVHRIIADAGPPPGLTQMTDNDYAEFAERLLQSHPAPDLPTRLFAFGSLIWKPEITYESEERASAHGWHRSFCLALQRFRGTIEQPGLMMALDRGGQCDGVVFTLPNRNLPDQIDLLLRREMTILPSSNLPRWIRVRSRERSMWALVFTMNQSSPNYRRKLPLTDVADTLAKACGHWGSGAEYLLNTVSHLQARGIHDGMLWRLQQLVAARIEANGRSPQP